MSTVIEFTLDETQEDVLVNLRRASFSLTVNTHTVYNFDGAGRLLGAYRDGYNYLRGLDNRLLMKWGAGHGLAHRSRRDTPADEKRRFFDEVQSLAYRIGRAVDAGRITPRDAGSAAHLDEGGRARLSATLALVQGYDALEADAARFRTIYKPVSILPPDQYLAVVLQATEGCSWNKCTFCDFYKDRRFRIKGDAEFRAHIRAVKSFFGPALPLRTSIFLADANALVIPQERLLSLLSIVHAELPIAPTPTSGAPRPAADGDHVFRGIYSFVDAFTSRHKSAADYGALADLAVRRVYIGLESGSDELLDFLHKGSSAADALNTVAAIKAGGVDVGVILMLGVGGRRYAQQHVAHSIQVINAMGLGERDILYFSPFMDFPGSEYGQLAAEQGIEPLTPEEMDAQMAEVRAGLRFAQPERRPKIAVYDIREFIY